LGVAGGQILAFSIDLLRRPYNTLALPCECVICQYYGTSVARRMSHRGDGHSKIDQVQKCFAKFGVP